MGVVYRAHARLLDRDVTLKFLPGRFESSPEETARYEREAREISALNHLSIATMHDMGNLDRCPHLVREHVPGGTLTGHLPSSRSPFGCVIAA